MLYIFDAFEKFFQKYQVFPKEISYDILMNKKNIEYFFTENNFNVPNVFSPLSLCHWTIYVYCDKSMRLELTHYSHVKKSSKLMALILIRILVNMGELFIISRFFAKTMGKIVKVKRKVLPQAKH